MITFDHHPIYKFKRLHLFFFMSIACVIGLSAAVAPASDTSNQKPKTLEDLDPSMFLMQSIDQESAQEVHPSIFKATGFGNTFLVTTTEGNVIIDTSLPNVAPKHKALLTAVSSEPVRAIIVTHGHGDHTGGIHLWRQEGTEVIMHAESVEFLHYQKRLEDFFKIRNASQFGFDLSLVKTDPSKNGNYDAIIPATILVNETHTLKVGQYTFEIMHTPGETYDAISIFIPEIKALFIGDLFYQSFPNIYTLRGTKPRWALDYAQSIDKVLALEPEIMLPSHGEPIYGVEAIFNALTKYRDAVLYVHDKTVEGMNQGKDVYTLMQEIRLPENLDIGEGYGKISWSVRGIYEGYAGWFDGNPASMYAAPSEIIIPELVRLAGGADKSAELAGELLEEGCLLKALRLTQGILQVEPENRSALKIQLVCYKRLRQQAVNFNEAGWLNYGIKQTEKRLSNTE
ncbi:MAG: alkyl sulfatase dimerization domain-containing protein [Desulfobacterales bacterium]